jgi:hypothetical protein
MHVIEETEVRKSMEKEAEGNLLQGFNCIDKNGKQNHK